MKNLEEWQDTAYYDDAKEEDKDDLEEMKKVLAVTWEEEEEAEMNDSKEYKEHFLTDSDSDVFHFFLS